MSRYTDDLREATALRLAQQAHDAQLPDDDEERTPEQKARHRIEAARWARAEAQEVRP